MTSPESSNLPGGEFEWWEIPTVIIADEKKRLRIPAVHPHDVYHPETLTHDLIILRRVESPKPKRRTTREQIERAIRKIECFYICSTTSIPRTSRPSFKTRDANSQMASLDSRISSSALRTGQFS